MHRIFRHSLISFLFFAVVASGAFLAPKPAQAACTCVGDVSNLLAIKQNTGQNGALCTCLKDNLIGSISSFPWKLPGLTGNINGAGQPKSLVEYFENVYWPRMIAMQQKMGQEQAQTNAANTHTNVQAVDASKFVDYTQDISRNRADTAVSNAGRTDVACPEATMSAALTGARVVARMETYNLLDTAISTRDGSADAPESANGLVNFYNEMVEKRNALGLCNPKGNNNMDAEWCVSSKEAIRNADVNPAVVEASAMLGTNPEEKNFHQYATRMKDNMFAFIFTPLRKDQVTGARANQINEVLFDRLKFNTQVSNLELPFALDIGDRKPVPGVDAAIKNAYLEQLKLAGVDQANAQSQVASLWVDSQTKDMSKLSMEEIYFRQKNLDPSEISRVAGASALNLQNIVTYQTYKVMNSLVLLFDIRQELRMTNKLLGTIGSILAADRQQAIEAKIQGVSAN